MMVDKIMRELERYGISWAWRFGLEPEIEEVILNDRKLIVANGSKIKVLYDPTNDSILAVRDKNSGKLYVPVFGFPPRLEEYRRG